MKHPTLFPRLISYAFLVSSIFLLSAQGAQACSSGCGIDTNGLSGDVKELMLKAKAEGRNPVSCIRTQACQDRLRSCYERQGQYGRAARRSAHSDGKACDYSPQHRGPLRNLKNKLGLRSIQDLVHRQSHGGGLHVFTTAFRKDVKRDAPTFKSPANAPLPPKRPDNLGEEREPASAAVPAISKSEYPQLSNGRYDCPRNMRSICGSTKDFPWCRQWMSQGNTPGCK
jgi:hypothetical protein